MAWTSVSAFTDQQVVTHTIMNQLADNIDYLRSRVTDTSLVSAETTTTSTTFVSMGASFEKTITTYGGPVLVLLTGAVRVTGVGTEIGRFDIEVDGARIGHTTGGIMAFERETNAGSVTATPPYTVNIGAFITGLSAASHTIKMMWTVASGGTLRIGHNASDVRFYVKEF
jgi:hypothetical protein